MSKLAVVRLKGLFSTSPNIKKTLESLKLSRLYACTLVPMDPSYKGMLQEAKDVLSFGEISKETVALLLKKRGRTLDGKKLSEAMAPEDIEKLAEEIFSSGKKPQELGVQNVFFLSPPKGGFGKSRKASMPYGPLGKNDNISELIARMV
jgi:large subunit ribosomal protein L30